MFKSWRNAAVVLFLCAGVTVSAQNMRMGPRYHLIDKEVESVTTGFAGMEITTTRTGVGTIEMRMRTNEGRTIGDTEIMRPEQIRFFTQKKDGSERTAVTVDARPLDAVNAAAYLAHKSDTRAAVFSQLPDLARTEGPFELRGVSDDIKWVKSRTAKFEAYSRIGGRGLIEGKELPSFTSVVREGDEVLGIMAWYPGQQHLLFQTKWRQEPFIVGPTSFKGGKWTFTPNMAWANIQLLSFAKSADAHGHKDGPERLKPVVNNSPGCDGLHWLDGTVFRECCDVHDACYYKEDPDCTAHSWWFQGSWSCVQCNIEALFCFASIIDCGYSGCNPPYDWDGPANCYIEMGCYCPSWCWGCEDYFNYNWFYRC